MRVAIVDDSRLIRERLTVMVQTAKSVLRENLIQRVVSAS